MDKAKELVTTLTAHLPEWCAEWIPDVDQWQWQQWHPADLWQWARTREWRVPELPRWGEDRRLVPEWIFPSYWRKRVRETVLWVWLIFITFLATREERAQREVEGPQLKNDSGADDQQQKILTVPEEGEEEEDDEDTGAWRGGLERPGGLTRYPGIENLLAQPPTATPPPPRHRPPPPVAATQVSNKQILPKPDETQSRKNESREGENEESGEKNHQDEVWKTLLAKYGTEECVREIDKAAEEDDEEEVPEYVGTAEEIVERYSAKFEEPRQDMSPEEEFSAKVGRRLEEYLERLDEDDEESSQAKEVEHKTKGVEQTEKKVKAAEDKTESEEARDIEDGGERLEGITSNGNENRIFIVIEDEESEDDRRNLNDISECSEISQALETQDAEVKDEGQLEKEMKKLSSLQNGLSSEAEPQAETAMETVPEASGKVGGCEEIVEQAADTMQLETPNEAAEGMKDELKDDIVNVPEEQPSDATMEEKGKEMEEEYTKGVIEKIPDTLTTYVAEDRTEESLKLSSGEEVKLEEDAEVTSIEPPKEQVETVEQEYTEQTSSQPPEEVKEEEVQTLATAEEVSERHDNVSEDVIMKEQDSIESEALATRHEAQEKTIEDKAVKEEEEEKDRQIKENETLEDKEKETLEIKAATDVSVEENKVVEQETAKKDAREDEKVLETEIYVKPPEDVRKEAVEEEKKQEVEAEVTEDEEKEVPADKAAGVAITEPPAVVEEIQVDEEAHFEDGKTEESKDEAMVVEEHMEDEQVPVASVEGWTQDVWGTLGQAPGEAVPLAPPAAIDMMEEDTEDVMDVDVEDEVGETMEEDLEVFVDDVDLRELPESPVPLPTVPEEEDHLAEVQDLLVRPPPRKHRRRQRQEEELADTKGINEAAAAADPSLAKYMTMPHALSPEEEEELRKYLAESGDAKDLSVDKFMSMPAALTEQEQNELEEAVRERERVRQAESAGLDRFLDMPVGLTEQEIRELKDLEREKEEAAEQPWERGDVGFEDYLSMPHTLTEEEERMLQEGEEDEEDRQFASEEEYREYVKNKFLSQLEEDALRMAEEDYDYDEDYDDEYEYEDDEEYEDEEENEDEDEGEMEGEYVMVSDLAAASNLPQAAAAPAAATAAPAKMVDEAVNTELNDPKEDAKSKKKPFPFPKKGGDRETTPEDSNVAAQKKFFHFGSLGTKRKKETPDFLDKKSLGNPNGRKFDGGSGGGGGSLSAAFCTVGDQVTRVVLQKLKRQGKAAKEAGPRKACTGLSESGGVGSANTSRGFTRPYLKPDQRDSGASDEEIRLSNLAEHLNAKNELEHVFAKIIKSYKSPSDQTTHGSEDNYSDNVTKLDTNEASRTPDVSEQKQEEDATTVFTKDTENDLMNSPILDIIMEEDEEEMDAEVALVFTGEREVVKAGGEEEDFWLRWSNEERACVSAARDCCSPWQLAEGADPDREDNEEAVRWGVEKEGSSQTEVKVTVNNEENDKTNRNEEEKETVTETKEVMGKECKSETIRESKAEETQRGSAMANVETTDAAVSNAQLEADSLEFGVNTNLSVIDDSASPKGASPSLQELIEAELNVRLCQPDSLEPPSPDPSSLLSCDSIEPTPHTLISALTPAKAPPTATPTGLTLDSLLDLDSLQDTTGMADTESGIDVLSPTKLDDLSALDMDSLESSSDLPGSSHCSPEPTVTLTTRVSTVEQKDTHLTIVQTEDPLLPNKKCVKSLEAEGALLAPREDDSDAASLGDLQVAPPLLRISESSLTIASETRSELSQVSQEVTRSSTPDSLTSFEGGSASQDSAALQDNDVPQEITQDSDVLDNLLLQNNVVPSEGSAPCVPDSDSMQGTVEVQQIVTISHTVDTQQIEESSSLLDGVSPSYRKVSQEDIVNLLASVPQQEVVVTQDSVSHLQQNKHTETVVPGDLVLEETNLLPSPESSKTPAESSLSPAHDPASPSSPQSQDCSSPFPSPEGALPLSGTNSVCVGDLSNSARDDCGDVGVSSGRVDTTNQAVSSSDGGGGVGVSGPVTSLQNGSNMESQVEDEDNFWGSKNDDDMFVPRRRFDPVQNDQEEDDTGAKEEEEKADEAMEEEEEEEEEEGNNFFGSDEDDKGAKGLRFKKRTTTTTRTENGIGGIEKKKEVVEQVEKKKHIEESGGKKIEVTTEKKKVEVREERKKADVKEEKKKEVEEEKKKEAIEEEDKENGIAEDGGEKKKKKKKHRDSEDGERLRKKKKKKRDSEKENKKAAYQKRDDILEKHVGPRVRSFDAAKMKSKFEKPKQVSQVSSECRQCGKQVFQMEKIVAEKAAWHKNCFRCKECNCILTLETYQSHEGVLYCKPHFKELFRPKVVVEDPDEARKERLLRRPKLIVLESQPMELAEGVVRSTNKPDYGLEDLTHANLKQKFKMFEQISTEEDRVPDTIPVRRSQSLLTKAARFMQSDDDYGIENSELGEYDEDEEDEDYEEDEEEDDEEGEEGEDGKLNKSRAASFSGMKDLKAGFARKNRQDELTKKRRQELAKFRQMLCAGKNISTREIFEGGNEDEKGQLRRKEQIKIEGQIDAKNLRERFEKGLSVVESDSEESNDRREVDRVFKEAETASKARNLFKQIDKTVAEGGEVVLRPASSAQARRENRLSRDGIDMEELELGRDPNLVKCTDNYEDEVDCRGTRKLLAKFKKMEKQAEILDKEGEEDYDSDEEYSDDDESSDEEEEDSEEEDSEEEDSEEEDGKPKYKDEVLEMVKSSQSAKKAASLRAKFEKWESEVERNNEYNQSIERYEDEDECMPSIDTARNLRAMFENKAQETTQPVGQRPKVKVNRFV